MSVNVEEVPKMELFERLESEVRSYSRSFPTVFTKSRNDLLWDEDGKEYIDFFAGAGALNYGHNNVKMKEKIVDYIMNDGVIHSLDMATKAKSDFLEQFNKKILEPRNLDYKVMFTGPTGTNSVESALKLARKKTGRQTVMGFTNGFHGMSLGALAVTGNRFKRAGAGVPLNHGVSVPFYNYYGEEVDTIEYLERFFEDDGSGVSLPAAIILETVQGEGGINVASYEWLKKIEEVCRKWDILLIVDDIQAGCGRTGTFFSFEKAGIVPDLVCLSKSIGGYGLPMAITLIKPDLDLFEPGEHNGTFRGNNLAFLAATEALNYWETNEFTEEINEKSNLVQQSLEVFADKYPVMKAKARGRGLMQGISFDIDGMAENVCKVAFEHGLIMETSGADSEVAKLMPPLTIEFNNLKKGLQILEKSIDICHAQLLETSTEQGRGRA